MLPEERVYRAISGELPDRVPVVPKIWVDTAATLMGVGLENVIQDPLVALEVIVEAGLAASVDAVRQFHFPQRRIKVSEERVFEVDKRGRIIGEIDMQGGLTTRLYDPDFFQLGDPYMMAYQRFWSATTPFVGDVRDAREICVPTRRIYTELGWAERQREIQERVGGRMALIGDCDSATLAFYVSLRGLAQAMYDLVERPKLVHAVMEKGVAIAVEKGKFNLDLGIKVLRLNDSVGNMSVISPENWREFVFPHLKDVCDELHRYDPDCRIYCHICGNIMPIIKDLVAAGLDCIGPLDPLGGSTCAQARQEVGNTVALLGGVNTLSFVTSTPTELIEEARMCMVTAGKNGRYLLSSGCVVPRGTPLEMLQALVEAANRYGVYAGDQLSVE